MQGHNGPAPWRSADVAARACRQARPPRPSSSTSRVSSPPTTRRSRTLRTRHSAWPSAPPATAARRSGAASTKTTSWPSARRSGVPALARHHGPLFIGMDTHALSEPALGDRPRGLRRERRRGADPGGTGYTPTPVISHAILTYNRGPQRGPRRRRRDHAFAQPARRRRLQVQPAQRRPGRHRRHEGDRGRGPTRSSRGRPHATSSASPSSKALTAPRPRTSTTTSALRRATWRTSSTWRPSPRRA